MAWAKGAWAIFLGLAAALQGQQAALASDHKVTIHAPPTPSALPTAAQQLQDVVYPCSGDAAATCNLARFFERVRVCSLMVLKNDEIVLERYHPDAKVCHEVGEPELPNDATRVYPMASVTKSITSTLVGLALVEKLPAAGGAFDPTTLEMPVDRYLGELASGQSEGGYAGVPIDRLLRMRSGAKFKESGWFSDAVRLDRQVVAKETRDRTFLDFARTIKPRSGGVDGFNYAGLDTAVLGLFVERLIGNGEHLGAYLERKLWQPLGMAEDTTWKIDLAGTPAAYCCFGMSTPDLARFGRFVLAQGKGPDGRQLLPATWFELATRRQHGIDDSIPKGPSYNSGCPLDYRYQWWLFKQPRRDFTAVGVHGEFLHVMPEQGIVIAQTGDWGNWENGDARECESFDVHDAIAAALGG